MADAVRVPGRPVQQPLHLSGVLFPAASASVQLFLLASGASSPARILVLQQRAVTLCAARLRDLRPVAGQGWCMLAVVDDARMAAGSRHAAWSESFNEMFMHVAAVFSNARVRRHGRSYVLGLLSHAERKNSWQLAEFAGDASPDGMQRLLNFSRGMRTPPGTPWPATSCGRWATPAAVLAVDETGFLKKGRMSASVSRQYTGTAGRIENCQVGVFAAYVTPDGGRALIDRELYLPEKWTSDRDRCRAAGIGDEVAFATKPQLAGKVTSPAREAGIPFSWSPAMRSTAATRACAAGWRSRASRMSWPWPAMTSLRWRPAGCGRTRRPDWSRRTGGSG